MKLYVENDKHETFVDAQYTCPFVYAHGNLEEKSGYDIVCTAEDNFDVVNDRIENVTAILADGTEIPSVLFFWHFPVGEDERLYAEKHPTFNCKGLVVEIEDDDAMRFAERKYNQRRSFV